MHRKVKMRFYILLLIAILLILIAIFGPLLAPKDPYKINLLNVLSPPNRENLLGTDRLGRDFLSRILYASRNSFALTFAIVLIISFIGSAIGIAAGYFGGLADKIIMQIADVLLAFPAIVFAIAVVGVLAPGVRNLLGALAVICWAKYARLTRGLVFEIRNREYITQALFGGCRWYHIICRYIMPNILPHIIVTTTSDISEMMITLSALSYLGLSTRPPVPEWGSMLANNRIYIMTIPHMALMPAFAILITVVVFSLLGDSLRDFLDPRMRG